MKLGSRTNGLSMTSALWWTGILVLSLLFAAVFYPPITDRILSADGHVLYVYEPECSIAVDAGDTASAEFLVRNVTDESVKIYGAEMGCGCSSINELPMTIAAHQSENLKFNVQTIPEEAGTQVVRDARLFLDRESPLLVLRTVVEVVGQPPQKTGGVKLEPIPAAESQINEKE